MHCGEILDCSVDGSRWRVMHRLPGRLRLQLVQRSLDGELAQALAHQCLQRRWVHRFRINRLAGSLVLEGRSQRLGRKRAMLQLLQQAAQQEAGLPLSISPRLEARSLRRLGLVGGLFCLNALLDLPLVLLLLLLTPQLFVPLLASIWSERQSGRLPSKALDLLWYGSLALRGHSQALLLEWGIEVGNHSLLGWTPNHGQRDRLADRLEAFRRRTPVRTLQSDGTVTARPLAELQPGDRLLLIAGDRVPCHGLVMEGEAVITSLWADGRSVQIPVQPFQQLPSGVQLVHGSLRLRVIHAAAPLERRLETLPVRAPQTQPPAIVERAQTLHDRSLPLLLLAGAGLLAAGNSGGASGLLQFDPASDWQLSCSLLYGAVQRDALTLGVVLKRPEVSDAIARSRQLLITESVLERLGQRVLAGIHPLDDTTSEELIQIVAGFRCRQRPFGLTAFLPLLHELDLDPYIVDDLESVDPHGWRGIIRGERVELGGQRLLRSRRLSHAPAFGVHPGITWLYVLRSGRLIGAIALRVQLSRRLIRSLKRMQAMGIALRLLMASDLQLADVVLERLDLPADALVVAPDAPCQLAEVNRCRKAGPVMLLGSADADAPLLAAADVGLTLAEAQPLLSQNLADVMIAPRCLDRLPAAIALCRQTHADQAGQATLVLLPHLVVVLVNLLIPIHPLLAVLLVDLPILTSELLLVRAARQGHRQN